MASSPKSEAEVRYARAQKRQQEAQKAQSDFEVENRRVEANTVRLRALRLAKEAADKATAAAAPPVVKAKRKSRAKAIPVDKLNASNDD